MRPFGFVEFGGEIEAGNRAALAAIDDHEASVEGVVIGGRRVRIEIAKNNAKLVIKLQAGIEERKLIAALEQRGWEWNRKEDPHSKTITVAVKIEAASQDSVETFLDWINREHPSFTAHYIGALKNGNSQDECPNGNGHCSSSDSSSSGNSPSQSNAFFVAEGYQRSSGLFQLRVPDSGVLPVSPLVLAKISAGTSTAGFESVARLDPYSPDHYGLISPASFVPAQSVAMMTRSYEDWHADPSTGQTLIREAFQDQISARFAAVEKLSPPLGESDSDIFIGRLDNQIVSFELLKARFSSYGPISFIRICNRGVTRPDNVPVDATAFVRFANDTAAQECISKENGATWLGRCIKCERCWPCFSQRKQN